MFDKLFGWGKKKTGPTIEIPFGRYSDNNKPVTKVARWTDADNFFKDKKYPDWLDAFFDYLKDDVAQNVTYQRNGQEGRFEIYQGSKIVRGVFNQETVKAEVTLARMAQPSVPVMRRLLEMNFSLYYSRFALDSDRLCMRFDSSMAAANPNKLYYGLKELSIKADKQDDLLVQDFTTLETLDSEHIGAISNPEKEVKFEYFQKWINHALETIAALDADKFSGGISYTLLSLAYRIDYLITPEGKLLYDLEKIAGIYFKKDERPATEKNRDMIAEFKKLQAKTKEEIFTYLFRSKYTFAIVAPQTHKVIADSIHGANQNALWYRDNNHHWIGIQVAEYGISYCQYSYSLPKCISDFFNLFMQINYGDYFQALGYSEVYYDQSKNQFNTQMILDRIRNIQDTWRQKYPLMQMKTQNLKFDNLMNFALSFTTELELLNMEPK